LTQQAKVLMQLLVMDHHQEWKVICLLQVWKVICLQEIQWVNRDRWMVVQEAQEIWLATLRWDLPIWVVTQQWDQPIWLLIQILEWPLNHQKDQVKGVMMTDLLLWTIQQMMLQQRDQPIWVVTQQWDQRKVHLTRYLVMQGQPVVIQQWALTCLQWIQWVNRDQWMVDQADLVICHHQRMIWEKCIHIWMMQLHTVHKTLDQEHQTQWLATWMEMV
jgi:hypothetical protein